MFLSEKVGERSVFLCLRTSEDTVRKERETERGKAEKKKREAKAIERKGTHANKCGVCISAGSACTALPSSHSQPSTTSSPCFKSRNANTAKLNTGSSFCSLPHPSFSFSFSLSFPPSRPSLPGTRSPLPGTHNTGLNTAFGQHPLLTNLASPPVILASKATSNGGPSRCTNGFGIPRWAYALSGSAR